MQSRWPIWLSTWQVPVQCLLCRSWPVADVVCPACWQRFAATPFRCTGCAQALPGLSPEHPRCGQCLHHPPVWQQCHAWQDYVYPWAQLLTRWKFGQQPAMARHLARWMLQSAAIARQVEQANVLLPIPQSAQRMRERGYHPAAQLVQHLSREKAQLHTLVRSTHTVAQSRLTRAQRLRNLRQAFSVPATQAAHIAQRHVLLVDDVMTTGATCTAATQCLLRAGAASVQVLCALRTP